MDIANSALSHHVNYLRSHRCTSVVNKCSIRCRRHARFRRKSANNSRLAVRAMRGSPLPRPLYARGTARLTILTLARAAAVSATASQPLGLPTPLTSRNSRSHTSRKNKDTHCNLHRTTTIFSRGIRPLFLSPE